jgi:hypothetical protein
MTVIKCEAVTSGLCMIVGSPSYSAYVIVNDSVDKLS